MNDRSVYLSIGLAFDPSLYHSIDQSIHARSCRSIDITMSTCICLSLIRPLSLSLYISICLPTYIHKRINYRLVDGSTARTMHRPICPGISVCACIDRTCEQGRHRSINRCINVWTCPSGSQSIDRLDLATYRNIVSIYRPIDRSICPPVSRSIYPVIPYLCIYIYIYISTDPSIHRRTGRSRYF